MRVSMNENMVKIKIPLPANDASGGDAEWLWAEPEGDSFVLKNIPIFVYGLSYGDSVRARKEDDILVFQDVVRRGGHSTYRIYAKSDRSSAEVANVLNSLEKLHCDLEPATNKIVGVDVLPEADVYEVYRVLEGAERSGILEFEEGHCGHPLKT
jgi:Domain of unknown function (DUF4265)